MSDIMEYCVYVLQSKKDGALYIGQTNDLVNRIKEHNDGKVFSTKGRRPLELRFYETFSTRNGAVIREKFLKSGCSREYIRSKLPLCPGSSVG